MHVVAGDVWPQAELSHPRPYMDAAHQRDLNGAVIRHQAWNLDRPEWVTQGFRDPESFRLPAEANAGPDRALAPTE